MKDNDEREDGPVVVRANSMSDRRRGWIDERERQLAETGKKLEERRVSQPRDGSEKDKDLGAQEKRHDGEQQRLQQRKVEIRQLG